MQGFPGRGVSLLPLLLLLVLFRCPFTEPCPSSCSCAQPPLTVNCGSRGLQQVPRVTMAFPGEGASGPGAEVRLFLPHNRISELDAGSVPTGLTVLWLYSNNLTTVSPGALRGLARLEEVDLGDNPGLSSLSEDTFWGLVRLRSLQLPRCGLWSLPGGLFQGLSSLRYLSLQENHLSELPRGLFDDLSQLRHLFLHGNRIQALAADTFRGLRSLDRLLLHRNLLWEVEPTAFRGLVLLDTLFLFENRLRELPGLVFQPLASLRFLRLSGNPWACDCRALPLRRWFRTFAGASSALDCSEPPRLRGKDLRLLTPADFRGCQGIGASWRPEPGPGPGPRPGRVELPANWTEDTGLSEPPSKGQGKGQMGNYWPGDYDYGEGLSAPGLGRCEGQGCWRNAAGEGPGIFPFPVWALALLWDW
ncbi:reticulon-4 receptor-like 2 [Stegostoma tigrinum]|uniref:reticulon-4 receptor-like 2 n=1 Tax=Stegostoma tigrinum TaxID=3053191 RepID=UPI00202AC9C3|nr:reticulon-4 receptor-like 2 [Stegostoma tigrinum]